jgi:DNA polymerase-3 subunit epsilon
MPFETPGRRSPLFATSVLQRPTTLSARAAQCLANGPVDALALMRDVCQVDRLQVDAAERMALALLSSHEEFVQLPSGHWSLRDWEAARKTARAAAASAAAPVDLADPDPNRHPDAGDASGTSLPSLLDIDFAVVDVETTGTRAATGDRITEIAIAHVCRGSVAEVYSALVNPQRPIPSHITALTQITWEMVRDQPSFARIAHEVANRLSGHVFTAHNASFDWRFVSEELGRGAGQVLSGPRLCTVRLARVLVPGLARYSLDHVTHYFGIEIGARHRAEGDAVATAQVLVKLLGIAEDLGITTWSELDRRLHSPAARRARTAADRRRRAFPLPMTQDDSA